MEVNGKIQSYTMQERDSLIDSTNKVLEHAGIGPLSEDIFSCVDELIKNSVKANYKFILIREYIMSKIIEDFPKLTLEEYEEIFNEMTFTRISFDTLAVEFMQNQDISALVRQALTEEGKFLRILNTAFKEKRELTGEEQEIIKGLGHLNKIREKLNENNINIYYKVHALEGHVYLEITNTAPILTRDLKRIHEKRDEFRRCRNEGREHEFFINNIDTSESGFGLGYAKIDSILYYLGLEPEESSAIISAGDTTVMLILPLNRLKEAV